VVDRNRPIYKVQYNYPQNNYTYIVLTFGLCYTNEMQNTLVFMRKADDNYYWERPGTTHLLSRSGVSSLAPISAHAIQ